MHAAPGEHDRPLRLCDHRRGLLHAPPVRPAADRRRAAVAGIGRERLWAERAGGVADVFRHVDHHRPRTAGGRDREGAAHQFGNAMDRLDADHFLAGRAQDLDLAALLGHVLPGVVAMRVADQRHQRRAGIQGFHQPGDEVGRARPERGVDQADAAGHLGVGIGGEYAGALVVDQMMAQAEPARRVVERQQLKAAHAEHRAAAQRLDHAGDGLTAGDFDGIHQFSSLQCATDGTEQAAAGR